MSFTKTARNGDVMAPKGSTGGLFSLPEPGVPSVSNVPFPLKSRGGTRTRPNCRAQNSTDQKHHFGWGHQRSCSRATRHAAQADENASLATSPIRLVARGGQGNLTDLAQELPHRPGTPFSKELAGPGHRLISPETLELTRRSNGGVPRHLTSTSQKFSDDNTPSA